MHFFFQGVRTPAMNLSGKFSEILHWNERTWCWSLHLDIVVRTKNNHSHKVAGTGQYKGHQVTALHYLKHPERREANKERKMRANLEKHIVCQGLLWPREEHDVVRSRRVACQASVWRWRQKQWEVKAKRAVMVCTNSLRTSIFKLSVWLAAFQEI